MANRIVQLPVPLVLKKILAKKSHGELVITGENIHKTLYFSEGNLVFAETNVLEERLGEILFKIGKINRQQFADIHNMIQGSTEKLGNLLIQHNVLNHRDVFFALLYQLRTIAISTFGMTSGEWNFVSKIPEVPDDSKFNIQLPTIISEGANKIGNFAYFKNKFYYRTIKTKPVPESTAEFLSPLMSVSTKSWATSAVFPWSRR